MGHELLVQNNIPRAARPTRGRVPDRPRHGAVDVRLRGRIGVEPIPLGVRSLHRARRRLRAIQDKGGRRPRAHRRRPGGRPQERRRDGPPAVVSHGDRRRLRRGEPLDGNGARLEEGGDLRGQRGAPVVGQRNRRPGLDIIYKLIKSRKARARQLSKVGSCDRLKLTPSHSNARQNCT